MPSFLNKVFGYKRHEDRETARPSREASDNGLLDGKYEAIAPVVSPTAATFAEAQQDSDRDAGFSLFRPKGRGPFQKSSQKRPENIPHLTLHLPGPKENLTSRGLGVVFEADPDSQIVLDDAVIAAKRLNPSEALALIQACTQAITERGLETLGIMHPHWLSASPDVQRRLISLFIRSLGQTRITTLSPTPASSTSTFENELRYVRSPHDVAAVLRWALRHLSLENGGFGKESGEWGWYNAFFQAEREASYPSKGFSELLLPQLPASHIELLTTTLRLISSLASHAEANSISGSKLSKFLGLWLLVAIRAEESDDWSRFYARWERSGRILEHLFLSRLREESSEQRLPTRLEELIKNYPYNKGSPVSDGGLLSRPRFSTRQYEALFVRVETLLTHSSEQPRQHPIQLLIEAFQLPIDGTSGDEHTALWNILKSTVFAEEASSDSEGPQFARIFVDETIHLLSSIPVDSNLSASPTPLTTPITKVGPQKRSSSPIKTLEGSVSKSSAATPLSPPTSPTSPSSIVVADWHQFALSGFGDTPPTPLAAHMPQDDDVEVTQPPTSRKPSRRGTSRTRRRRSEDNEPLDIPPSAQRQPEPSIIETKLASVHVVQLDEAFIDFWGDAIVDPISAKWPSFVVCGLKAIPNAEQPIRWLVIEQVYSRQEASRVPSPDGRRGRSPRPSFKSDISGFRINSVFSSARKRFSLFSKSATDLGLKKSGGKTPVAGELGEVVVEEEPSAPPANAGLHVDGNAAVNTAVTSGMAGDVTNQLEGGAASTAVIAGIPPTVVLKEESDPIQAVLKAPSIEPGSRSEGGCNGSSALPRTSITASEETIAVQRDSPRTLEAVLVRAENDGQDVTVNTEGRPVEPVAQIADRDVHVQPKSADGLSRAVQVDVGDDGSRGDVQAVAMPAKPDGVVLAAATSVAQPSVDDEAPVPAIEAPQATMKSSQKVFTDPAASSAELASGREIDDLAPLSATVIAIETTAHLEPSLVDEEVLEVPEHAEIPTPAPERATFVEETPSQEISADVCGHAPVAQPGVLDDAVAQLAIADDAASQPVAAELQESLQAEALPDPLRAEEPSAEVIGTSIEAVVAEAEPTADQVPAAAPKEAHPGVEGAIVQTADAEVVPAPKVESDVDVSAGTVPAEAEAQDAPESYVHEDVVVESQDTETPVPAPEYIVSADDASSYESAPAVTPKEAEAKTADPEPVVETSAPPVDDLPLAEEAQPSSEAELPTQVRDVQTVTGALYSGFNPEVATAALATLDEVNADTAEAKAKSTLDAPVNDEEACNPTPTGGLMDATSGIAVESSGPAPSAVAVESEPIEDEAPEPAAEEAQALVDAAPTASEPVAIVPIVPIEEPVVQDERASIEIDQAAPQSVDGAASPPLAVVADPIPEAVHVEEQVKLEVEQPRAVTVSGPLVEDTESVPRAIVDDREPETITEEDVSVPAPSADDVPALVETEEAALAAVGSSEERVVSQAEIDEAADADVGADD